MIDFDYAETAGWSGIQFAAIGAILSTVFFFVARLFGFRALFKMVEPGWYPWFFIIIPISTILGSIVALPAFWSVHKFRSLDLDKVSLLKIRETERSDQEAVPYTNSVEIRNVLSLMRYCRGVDHQHDELYDGYVMEVIMDDGVSADLFLKVYRNSTMKGGRQAIVAQYERFEADEYDCPEIQQWVVRNIDPLFGRRTASSDPQNSPPSQLPQ